MNHNNTQQYYAQNGSPPESTPHATVPEIVNAPPPDVPPENQQQQQYTAYIQQRYYAQQQYLAQQRQYAAYWQSAMRQRQSTPYSPYYPQVPQQYGYQPMMQVMNQMNGNHNTNPNYMNNAHAPGRAPSGPIILSSEEQPALIAADKARYKKRRRRKRKKLDSDDEENDNDLSIQNKMVSVDTVDDVGYDKDTLVNQDEVLPDINTEFDEWLYFTKQLWKRQRKYKNKSDAVDPQQESTPKIKKRKLDVLDLTESSLSISLSDDSSPSPDNLQIRSRFLQDRVRITHQHQKVLKNKKVVNIMIKMGLAPPWNEMPKYDKWKKCYHDMFD